MAKWFEAASIYTSKKERRVLWPIFDYKGRKGQITKLENDRHLWEVYFNFKKMNKKSK